MTIADATAVLAELYVTGYAVGVAERRALKHLYRAAGHGREWEWSAAESALDAAYRALKSHNPSTGYAWHCGLHPIQTAAELLDAE